MALYGFKYNAPFSISNVYNASASSTVATDEDARTRRDGGGCSRGILIGGLLESDISRSRMGLGIFPQLLLFLNVLDTGN